jgi:hypothetical protein
MKVYKGQYHLSSLLTAITPKPEDQSPNYKISGVKNDIDVIKLNRILSTLDVAEIRHRRRAWIETYHEARMLATDSRGIKFTDMLLLLARRKIIKTEDSFE